MFESPKALAAAVVQAVADSNAELLHNFCLTEQEYRDVVWANLDSNEAKQIPFEMSWGWNVRDTDKSIRRYVQEYAHHELQLTTVHKPRDIRERNKIKIVRGTRIEVSSGQAEPEEWRMLNVILEYQGWYKVITYND